MVDDAAIIIPVSPVLKQGVPEGRENFKEDIRILMCGEEDVRLRFAADWCFLTGVESVCIQ